MFYFSNNVQSAQYCFKFYVSNQYVCSCPGDPCITTTTTLVYYKLYIYIDFNLY